MAKKILYIISEVSGGGHLAVSDAIRTAIKEIKGDSAYEHKFVDLFARTSPFYISVCRAYGFINEHLPWAYNFIFNLGNDPARFRFMNQFAGTSEISKRVAKLFEEEKPDLILSLFQLSNHVTVDVAKKYFPDIPTATVVQDLISIHYTWVDPRVDLEIVPTEEAKQACIKFGMDEKKIKLLGFPMRPHFLKPVKSKVALRSEWGLQPDLFTIFLIGGGVGIGKLFNVVQAIEASDLKNIQLIVVAGFNKKLEEKLLQTRFRFPIKVFGFTDRVPEIMSASDLIVTKAGPGTVMEAITKELPMILNYYMPQEKGNIDYVESNDLGVYAREPKKIVQAIKKMLQASELERIKNNIRKVSHPRAIYDIAEALTKLI
jgi:1,2-diacylglycerol 3-beta-galactosyltransferase